MYVKVFWGFKDQASPKKTGRIRSMKYWLLNRDPYDGLL